MENNRLNTLLAMYDPASPDSFVLFAIAKEYEYLGDIQTAILHFEKLRSADENYTGLYFHLADLYAKSGETTKAFEIYDQGITITRKLADHHALSELMNARQNLELDE
ncbi:MAG: tetratricopeptide repeat protein [Saprospiraceae bacterium]|nr:tetratricopeptide repeat protein [Saprospiraceae bacterium]